jgi:hypothetical protein
MLAGAEKAFQVGKRQDEMTASHALFAGLIDYAGLFPPAALDMASAVRNYASYRTSEHAYMLGRFIVSAQRLEEFLRVFDGIRGAGQGTPWPISVLGSGDWHADAELLTNFDMRAMAINAIEVKMRDEEHLKRMSETIPSGIDIYVELKLDQLESALPMLKRFGARAKVRTGGLTAEDFPAIEQLARFFIFCAREKIACKLTAGLHHPLRSVHKLTYEIDSKSATMHGFVNVFVAAVASYSGAAELEVKAVLGEQSSEAFQWCGNKLSWRGHTFSTDQIRQVRENFAISFGSCSFTEPVDDLKALGWL